MPLVRKLGLKMQLWLQWNTGCWHESKSWTNLLRVKEFKYHTGGDCSALAPVYNLSSLSSVYNLPAGAHVQEKSWLLHCFLASPLTRVKKVMMGWPKKSCIPLSTSLRVETPVVKSCCDDGATITGRFLPNLDIFHILKQTHTHTHTLGIRNADSCKATKVSVVIENSGRGDGAVSVHLKCHLVLGHTHAHMYVHMHTHTLVFILILITICPLLSGSNSGHVCENKD